MPKCTGRDRGITCTNDAVIQIQFHKGYFGPDIGTLKDDLCSFHKRDLDSQFGWGEEPPLEWAPKREDVYHIVKEHQNA